MERGSGSNDRDRGRDRDMSRRRRSIMQPPKTPETPPSLTGSSARAEAQARRTPHCHFVICMKRSCRSDRATDEPTNRRVATTHRPFGCWFVGLSDCRRCQTLPSLSSLWVGFSLVVAPVSVCVCVYVSIYLYVCVCVWLMS